MRALSIALLIGLVMAAVAARAGAEDGYVVAINCGVVPAGAPIDLVLPDNAPEYVDLAAAIGEALTRAGHQVAPVAGLRAGFEVSVNNGTGLRGGQAVDPADVESYREGQERVRVPLWTGPSGRGGAAARDDTVRLTVMIHDKANGRCLWQGEANHDLRGIDSWTVARKLVPFLVPRVGERVDRTPVALD
ncbi:MAG: hypothetical protein AB7F67_00460 [Rhodospirillaceae bacterium]